MALEKRCTEYQTMDELFSDMEDDLMALMLWKRVLACIEHILRVLGETLGVTPQHLMDTQCFKEVGNFSYLLPSHIL